MKMRDRNCWRFSFFKINRIPKSNEEFNIENIINIKVLKANERKIITVQIEKYLIDFIKIFYFRVINLIIIPTFFYDAFRFVNFSIFLNLLNQISIKQNYILYFFFMFFFMV